MLKEILRVVLHMDKEEKWDILCQHIKDTFHEEEFTPFTFKVEIVITGAAVKNLDRSVHPDSNFEKKLKAITDRGVVIKVSNNDMAYYKVNAEDIYPDLKVVPDGVTELIIKQEEGYRYIKI